jgi:RNA polymerase sigma factor (sigma-70 family)
VSRSRHDHITDQEILDRFYTDADNEWLGIILERYTLLILGVCMKYLKNEEEARDAVQQVFLKVITELRRYRVVYFKSWLYMVSKNHCLMKLRDTNGKTATPINENTLTTPEDDQGIRIHVEKDRLLDIIESSLQELNKEQKQCVTLFYLEKKSYQEIAEKTGYSLMQVKSHIQNGKRNLRLLVDKRTNGEYEL